MTALSFVCKQLPAALRHRHTPGSSRESGSLNQESKQVEPGVCSICTGGRRLCIFKLRHELIQLSDDRLDGFGRRQIHARFGELFHRMVVAA